MESEGMVLDAQGTGNAGEVENSFDTYYDAQGAANKLVQPQAYHILGTPNDDNGIFLTHGILDLAELLANVKKKGRDSLGLYCLIAALLRCKRPAFRRTSR